MTDMSEEIKRPLPRRERYSVKDLLTDLKKIDPTPSVAYKVGTEILYYECTLCSTGLGDAHPVTAGLSQILDFLQHGYEQMLVRGDMHRTRDTPASAINELMKKMPPEALEYILERPGDYVYGVLESARQERLNEIERYKQIETGVRREVEQSPEDPDVYNKLRLLLWVLGRHKEAAEAFQTAKKLGWDSATSDLVAT